MYNDIKKAQERMRQAALTDQQRKHDMTLLKMQLEHDKLILNEFRKLNAKKAGKFATWVMFSITATIALGSLVTAILALVL